MSDASPAPTIDAVPLRHPWRWVAAVLILILLGLFLYGAATNDAYGWDTHNDVFDALRSRRPYKAAWPLEDALAEIESQRGRHFDPALVDLFVPLARELGDAVAPHDDEGDPPLFLVA